MATLFRQSKEIEADISEIATCINDTMHNLAVLAMTSVFLSSEGWHVLHLAQNGRENLQTLEFRRYMRKELLRVVGGFCMRMVHVFNQKHVQLFIALEKCGDADLEEGIRRCQFPACCLPPAVSSFHKWAETASIASLRAVKRLWTPYILKTERDHAGNQRRQARASHKASTWKRQVATYVCVRSKHHWAQLSQTYRLRQRCLSNMSWKAFEQRMVSHTGNALVPTVVSRMSMKSCSSLELRGRLGASTLNAGNWQTSGGPCIQSNSGHLWTGFARRCSGAQQHASNCNKFSSCLPQNRLTPEPILGWAPQCGRFRTRLGNERWRRTGTTTREEVCERSVQTCCQRPIWWSRLGVCD